MSEVKAPFPPETWMAAEGQLSVEYTAQIMNQIGAYAAEGMKRLSRNGIAVGGVLFGSRGEKSVRIQKWRPISCEHTKGAALVLSKKDRTNLAQLLHNAQTDTELEGLHAVGLFVSHTRDGVSLSDSDLELYRHFFPWSWQIALVVRPFRDRPSEAGFFVRDAEGRVKTDASHQGFQIDGNAAVIDGSVDAPLIAEYNAPVKAPVRERNFLPLAPSLAEVPRPAFYSNRQLWIWVAPIILALLIWAMLRDKPASAVVPPSLGLHAVETGGRFIVDWDKASPVIVEATRGILSVRDGDAPPVSLELDPSRLAAGNFVYARNSADVDVVLKVFPKNGALVEENTRFIGSPVSPVRPEDPQLDRLNRENEQLRGDLRRETTRNRELEDAIKALQNRIGVESTQGRK